MTNTNQTLSEIVRTGIRDFKILAGRALNPFYAGPEYDYKKMTSKEKEEHIKNLGAPNPTGKKFMSNPTEKEWDEYLRGIDEECKRKGREPEGKYPFRLY